MEGGPTALVLYGSAGRRVQITVQDLTMPEHLETKSNAAFIRKQWNSVASFWYNRVLKEKGLQNKSKEDILQIIESDIDKRWKKRKMESTLHKKRRRLLADEGPAGSPSQSILLTNVCDLNEYKKLSDSDKNELLGAIMKKIQSFASSSVTNAEIMIDETPSPQKIKKESDGSSVEACSTEKASVSTSFDDRVAFTCRFENNVEAANAIIHLHGAVFNGRPLLCRFWG